MVLLMSLSVAGLSFLRSVRQSVTSFCGVPSNSRDRSSPRFLGMGGTRTAERRCRLVCTCIPVPVFLSPAQEAGPPYPQATTSRVPLTDWSVNTSWGNTRLGPGLLQICVMSVTKATRFPLVMGFEQFRPSIECCVD
jgi:hypothetical protein